MMVGRTLKPKGIGFYAAAPGCPIKTWHAVPSDWGAIPRACSTSGDFVVQRALQSSSLQTKKFVVRASALFETR
jgi:hypothetical protein